MRDVLLDKHYGEISVEFTGDGSPWLHFRCDKFSHNIYREILDDFTDILTSFHSLGIDKVYSCIKADDTKTLKFQSMFGLSPEGTTVDGDNIVFSIPTYIGD